MEQNDLNHIELDESKLNIQKQKEKKNNKKNKDNSSKSKKNKLLDKEESIEVKIPKKESEFNMIRKNRSKEESFLQHKRKNIEFTRKENPQENSKKSKSEDTKFTNNSMKFFLKKEDEFLKVFDKWKSVKSLKTDLEGNITHKLSYDELILKNCQKIAINKLKEKKDTNYDEILNILSYDNTNQSLLYFCFQKMRERLNFKDLISEYKFCFCNESEIIDYFNDDKITKINVQKEFNFNFIFSTVDEGIEMLKNSIIGLLNLSSKNNAYNVKMKILKAKEGKKKKSKKINNIFKYYYDDQNELKESKFKNKEQNELHNCGYNWLLNYMKIRDFEKFNANQPYSFENNNILYLSFCIYELYKQIIKIDTNKKVISIIKAYFSLVINISGLLKDLIIHLDKKCIDKEFQYKIRFFSILFETKGASISKINKQLLNHIFQKSEPITSNDFENFINSKKKEDQKVFRQREYNFSNNTLKIVDTDGTIEFNFEEYNKNLLQELLKNKNILNLTWKKNSLVAFQSHNFLLNEDITFLKQTIRKIFKSTFWESICSEYCNNDFTEINPFKNDEFVDQFFESIIFLPFDINDIGLFAYTTADDLYIFISGYPFMKEGNDLDDYVANRILQLAVYIIIILHESIHYYKRLLYFLTCQMVSRMTIINGKREEGGNLLEKILFGEKANNKSQNYINLRTAFNLLNAKLYNQPIEDIRKILEKLGEEDSEDGEKKMDEEVEEEEDELEEGEEDEESEEDRESGEEEVKKEEVKKEEVKKDEVKKEDGKKEEEKEIIVMEEDELLINFKKILGLSNKNIFKKFFIKHKAKTVNASKKHENKSYGIFYNSSDHRLMTI